MSSNIAVLNGNEYALVITIGLDGVVDIHSSRVERPEAARLLRMLADRFEEAHGTTAGPAPATAEEPPRDR